MTEQQQDAAAGRSAKPVEPPVDPRASWATWTTQSIISGPGGVTTVEIGPISGDLTVHTTWVDGEARLTVQYTGALDWYTVAGSPVPAADETIARAVHQAMVNAVKAGKGSRAPAAPAG
ncbi:hypothetical protein [Kitasatospora purpeofusca]|uniref:hypothetical protein n=1 Tax=Kitasatospora purpeofusca TaxID=67352 RepID=UPI002A5A2B5F|nr:hypothetical protein [Kitasatospora purpeofusca]MDY0816509.1 hypothetical protein [Kitasatospora purpeofusca]